MSDWLYDKIKRVPPITDEQIAEMRHIEPVLKVPDSAMYRRVKDAQEIHPTSVSCIWSAEPTGEEFTFHTLNVSRIITQHHSNVFFKPSLAEVYAWIRFFMLEHWRDVRFFCLGEAWRIGSTCDIACECEVMGGDMLRRGKPIQFANGTIGHELMAE